MGLTWPLRLQTGFLFLTYEPCPAYSKFIEKSGISIPPQTDAAPRLRYDLGEIFDAVERPGFLISATDFNTLREKLISLETDGFYDFVYERFADVLSLQSSLSTVPKIPVTSRNGSISLRPPIQRRVRRVQCWTNFEQRCLPAVMALRHFLA
jgi:hypothetical protein